MIIFMEIKLIVKFAILNMHVGFSQLQHIFNIKHFDRNLPVQFNPEGKKILLIMSVCRLNQYSPNSIGWENMYFLLLLPEYIERSQVTRTNQSRGQLLLR